jgi:hypothetical protein
MPTSNGTQAGAVETAKFYAETDPQAALQALDRLGSRYVVVDPQIGGGPLFKSIPPWIGRDMHEYEQLLLEGDLQTPVRIYLPSYFRSMAVRLYLFDGQPQEALSRLFVIHTHQAGRGSATIRVIDSIRPVSTEQEARDYARDQPPEDLVIGGIEPKVTCVPLEGLPGLRLAYSSDSPDTVKVFERVR